MKMEPANIKRGTEMAMVDPGPIGTAESGVGESTAREEIAAIVACDAPGAHVVEDVPGAGRSALVAALARAHGPTLVVVPSHGARTRLAATLPDTPPVTIAFSYQLIAWATAASAFRPRAALRRVREAAAPRLLRAAARGIDFNIDDLDIEVVADVAKRLAARETTPDWATPELIAAYREREALAEGTRRERIDLVRNDPSLLAGALDAQGIGLVILFEPEIHEYAITPPLLTLAATRTLALVANPRRMNKLHQRRYVSGLVTAGSGHRHELSVSYDRSHAVATGLVRIDAVAPGATTMMTTTSGDDGGVVADIYPDYLRLLDALAAGLAALPGVTARRHGVDLSGVVPLDLACRDGRGQQILVVGPTTKETVHVRDQLTNAIEHVQDLSNLARLWTLQINRILAILDPDNVRGPTDHALEDGAGDADRHEKFSPADIIHVLWNRDHPGRDHDSVPELLEIAAALNADSADWCYVELGKHAVALLNETKRTAEHELASFVTRAARIIEDHIALLEQPSPRQVALLLQIAHNVYDLRSHGSRQAGTGLERWLPSASAARVATSDRLVAARALEARADAASRHPTEVLPMPRADEAVIGTIHAHAAGMREVDHLLIVSTIPGHFPATHRKAIAEDEACLWQSLWSMARRSVQFVGVRKSKFLDQAVFPGEVRVHRDTPTR